MGVPFGSLARTEEGGRERGQNECIRSSDSGMFVDDDSDVNDEAVDARASATDVERFENRRRRRVSGRKAAGFHSRDAYEVKTNDARAMTRTFRGEST